MAYKYVLSLANEFVAQFPEGYDCVVYMCALV